MSTRAYADVDEVALVADARDGDRDAFRELYLRHVAGIHRFLSARTNHQTADDLTAETFARAFAAIGRFDLMGAPLRAWLFRIARNLVIERARRQRDETSIIADQVDVTGDPSELVAGALEAERLRRCLVRLGDSHRTVLELRFLNQLNVAETAVVLQSSEEAVRSLTYRALRALRTLYETDGERR